ncbi:glycosyltransferase [Paenibacillus sp. SC116]|uniref:glycosyltransferase family 2 protein n=1 Tax=Paenibacillus sp. SC116 TaxID=2968986 RepID=UPI00215B1E29|nr:glycosyltransferase family A protein [Paenibacillus sp. SC116]MCR8842112.1 glycosyltransferase [Paenibacillus sp. SC116]
MISVLTITYRRPHLLEEAIESFLRQDFSGESEMVIINDSPRVEYVFKHPQIRIVNVKEMFTSIGSKLKFGFSQCKYKYIYRLDDDDLLAPRALSHTWDDIIAHPGYEIYRSDGHYFFVDNKFKGIYSNVNTGNVYTKNYLSRIEIPDSSFGEDYTMTFSFNANIYKSPREQKTMIYRWGMNTYHISGMGNINEIARRAWTDLIVENVAKERNTSVEEGLLMLRPHFQEDYYQQISIN